MTEQKAVYQAVVARGYREGWTQAQFITRQVCKLQEELAELAKLCYLPQELRDAIQNAGSVAREMFNDREAWSNAVIGFKPIFAAELADCQVVLFCIAEELNYGTAEMAVEKAESDVTRGVRK